MPFITTDSLNIHYETAGKGAETVLLLHGNFASWRWWRPLFERVPPGYRVFAPDARGCGDSSRPAEGYSITQLAADLLGFTTTLRLPPLHLVGHSLGGAVALQYTLDYPQRVRTLTLVAPAPAEGLAFARHTAAAPPALIRLFGLDRDGMLRRLDRNYQFLYTLNANRPLLRRALMRMAPTLNFDESFNALIDDASRMAPAAVVGHVDALDSWNVLERLPQLSQPVLILGGEQDILVTPPALARMDAALPRSELQIWPDVGHSPQLEQPDRFAQTLFGFLARHRRTQAPRWSASAQTAGIWRRLQGLLGRA